MSTAFRLKAVHLAKALRLAAALSTLLLAASVRAEEAKPVAASNPIATISGRTYFFEKEAIAFRLMTAANAKNAELVLTADGQKARRVKVAAKNGRAFLELAPFALAPGDWQLSTNGAPSTPLHIMSSIARTPFTFAVYQGSLGGGQWGYASPETGPQRARLWRDEYGINLIMWQNGILAVTPELADNLTLSEARFTTLNSIAGQHQPDGPQNDWSDPSAALSARHIARYHAQLGRKFGGFAGVHYADEPGLTYGFQDKDGKLSPYYQGGAIPADQYFGPMAVQAQREAYKRVTGKDAPDLLNPTKDMEAWMEFMRWRTTILGDVFAAATREVHAVDPKLLGYSQVYEWAATADGEYPPEDAKGLDVLSTHAYGVRQLGMWYPAHETDAMRSGAWNKPLWMLPTWLGSQAPEGGVRAMAYSTLARKVEGLTWPLDWFQGWPEAKEVQQKILPISAALYHAEKRRDAVGIFHSRDQALADYSKNVRDVYEGRGYAGRLNSAWLMALAAGYPTTRVVEPELSTPVVSAHKVLLAPGLTYARPQTIAALEKYVAGGGVLLLDTSSTVEIKGAQKLPFAFPDYFNSAHAGHPLYHEWSDRKRFDELIRPHYAALREALAPHAAAVAGCDDPMVMLSEQGAGAGKLLWAVNMAQEDAFAQNKQQWTMAPVSTTLRLPAGNYVAYDVFNRKRINERAVPLNLEKGDAKLFALLPVAIGSVKISSANWNSPSLDLQAQVLGAGKPINAVIPISVELIAPNGKSFRTIYRATQNGLWRETLPLGAAASEGRWQIRVTELLSGQAATQFVDVKPAKSKAPVFATTSDADVLDAGRIARALDKSKGEVLVLWGEAGQLSAAQKIVTMLQARGVTARADDAKNHLAEIKVSGQLAFLNWSRPLDINRQVVLVGNKTNNPLIARLTEKLQLAPRPVSENYPGAGRVLVFWASGAFGLENDIVTLYADDAVGIERGISALQAILKTGSAPREVLAAR